MRQRVLSWVIILGGLAAAIWAGLTITRGVMQPVSYWIVDDRTIGVLILNGPNGCEISKVRESPSKVQIFAECQEHFFSTGSAAGEYRYEFVIVLDSVLGARSIVDAAGNAADRCEVAQCP